MNTRSRNLDIISATEFVGRWWASIRLRILRWQLRAQQTTINQPMAGELEGQIALGVRQLLRSYPYWGAGHLWLAQHALARNDIEVAFASAQAVLRLRGATSEHARARRILACCQMKTGDYAGARAILSQLAVASPDWWEVREDYAAALIHAGEFGMAVRELAGIPDWHLSGEGRAALEFARSRMLRVE